MADNYSTNFFVRQEQARSNCNKLIIFFTIAVAAIIAVIYFALRLIWFLHLWSNNSTSRQSVVTFNDFRLWDPILFVGVTAAVSLIILIAGMTKMKELQGGGGKVAEMLGGKLIRSNTQDPAQRQLLNVVEEMAIASGVPVPQVFVLEGENGINAFAAGLTLHDTAIAVTRGALNHLNRDELQGVIGHEYSHILNGDTRLNIQLIGIIFGILFIGIIGGEMLKGTGRLRGKSAGLIMLAGLVLLIIGYAGSFMGRLIQSAVCRQKEFLADASAVQFTRNPAGLAGALKKIGGYISGSKINSESASQASHLFFGESHADTLFPNFLASHPPLIERIKCLDPHFDGVLPRIKADIHISPASVRSAPIANLYDAAPIAQNITSVTAKPADIIHQVGNPTQDSLIQSAAILAAIPDQLKKTLDTPLGAAMVIYALLFGSDCQERENQLNVIRRSLVNESDIENVLRLCDMITGLKDDRKLPLVELAVPQLRGLADTEKRKFLETINALISADGKTTLYEFSVQWILNQYLIRDKEELFSKTTFFSIPQIGYYILILLRALANAGNAGNADAALRSFNAGVARIPELASKKPDFIFDERLNIAYVNSALKQLTYSSFKIKQAVVDACAHCAFADGSITVAESELLRVISLTMHCPLPPFASDKQVS